MKGKHFVLVILAAMMAFVLCACAQQGASSGQETQTETEGESSTHLSAGEITTLGDVLTADIEDMVSSYDKTRYVIAFSTGEQYLRVVADMTDEVFDRLENIEPGNGEEQLLEILGEVPVKEVDVIADVAAVQEELDGLVGKTGAEIIAEGYAITGFAVNGDVTDCSAGKDSLGYLFTFEGVVDEGTADIADAVKDLQVSAVSCTGVLFDALGTEEMFE